MASDKTVGLIEAKDEHFAWMLEGNFAGSRFGLTLSPGGVDAPSTLELLRKMTGELLQQYGRGTWLVIEGSEVVGLCGYKRPPDSNGTVEIGYGIAASRRGRGLATRAVTELLRCAATEPAIRVVTAETSKDNPASLRVLVKIGFEPTGTRVDREDGELILWRRTIIPCQS